ncbi:MAG: YihY/virulence factor BrkB family protein [Clostridia bacterium]
MINFLTIFAKNYFKFGVSRSSACLSYYLVFSFFPLVLFLHSIIGIIDAEIISLYAYIDIFPEQLQFLVTDYLNFLSTSDNFVPFFVGLGLTLYSFTRYVNSLYHIINNIYGYERPRLSLVKSFFFTVSLMFSVYLMLFLTIIGGEIVNFLSKYIIFSTASEIFLTNFRVWLPAIYFFLILVLLYRFIPSQKITYKDALPGAFCAIIALFILSYGFSIYISNFSNYSIIYGSLSAIMLLMLWLYFASMVIVQGSILNKMLIDFPNI